MNRAFIQAQLSSDLRTGEAFFIMAGFDLHEGLIVNHGKVLSIACLKISPKLMGLSITVRVDGRLTENSRDKI